MNVIVFYLHIIVIFIKNEHVKMHSVLFFGHVTQWKNFKNIILYRETESIRQLEFWKRSKSIKINLI